MTTLFVGSWWSIPMGLLNAIATGVSVIVGASTWGPCEPAGAATDGVPATSADPGGEAKDKTTALAMTNSVQVLDRRDNPRRISPP